MKLSPPTLKLQVTGPRASPYTDATPPGKTKTVSPGVVSSWIFLPGLLTGIPQGGHCETDFSEKLGQRPLM